MRRQDSSLHGDAAKLIVPPGARDLHLGDDAVFRVTVKSYPFLVGRVECREIPWQDVAIVIAASNCRE